jgi:hypothetical protein
MFAAFCGPRDEKASPGVWRLGLISVTSILQ